MALVATLIANLSNPVLTPTLGEATAQVVNTSGLYWLADSIVCDITLPSDTVMKQARRAIADTLAGQPIDIIVQERINGARSF